MWIEIDGRIEECLAYSIKVTPSAPASELPSEVFGLMVGDLIHCLFPRMTPSPYEERSEDMVGALVHTIKRRFLPPAHRFGGGHDPAFGAYELA